MKTLPLFFGLLAALVSPLRSWAQVPVVTPATPVPVPADTVGRRAVPRLEKPRFVVLFDSRYSILNRRFVTLNGLKVGIELRNRLRLGAGIYFLSSRIPTRQARPFGLAEGARADLRFRYLAGYGEYVLLANRRWELSVPLQVGLGSAWVQYEAPGGGGRETPHEFMGVVEPSVAAQFKVFRWGGLGAGAGWRQPFFVSNSVQRELNGPVFYARAKVFLGDFFKVVRFRKRLFSQDGLRE